MSVPSADNAADLLVHYFSMIADAGGVRWDGDNDSEIRAAVDGLMTTARLIAQEENESLRSGLQDLRKEVDRLRRQAHGHGSAA